MQERQVTVEGTTFPLAEPFHVLATANPVEYEGTYPLPEAQLDRFLLRVAFGYPTRRRGVGRADAGASTAAARSRQLEPVTDAAGLFALQRACEARRRSTRRSGATASSWRRRPGATARC